METSFSGVRSSSSLLFIPSCTASRHRSSLRISLGFLDQMDSLWIAGHSILDSKQVPSPEISYSISRTSGTRERERFRTVQFMEQGLFSFWGQRRLHDYLCCSHDLKYVRIVGYRIRTHVEAPEIEGSKHHWSCICSASATQVYSSTKFHSKATTSSILSGVEVVEYYTNIHQVQVIFAHFIIFCIKVTRNLRCEYRWK